MSTQLIASGPAWLTSERGISQANGSSCCSIGRTIGLVSSCSSREKIRDGPLALICVSLLVGDMTDNPSFVDR
jgi:hypothetical protein